MDRYRSFVFLEIFKANNQGPSPIIFGVQAKYCTCTINQLTVFYVWLV